MGGPDAPLPALYLPSTIRARSRRTMRLVKRIARPLLALSFSLACTAPFAQMGGGMGGGGMGGHGRRGGEAPTASRSIADNPALQQRSEPVATLLYDLRMRLLITPEQAP